MLRTALLASDARQPAEKRIHADDCVAQQLLNRVPRTRPPRSRTRAPDRPPALYLDQDNCRRAPISSVPLRLGCGAGRNSDATARMLSTRTSGAGAGRVDRVSASTSLPSPRLAIFPGLDCAPTNRAFCSLSTSTRRGRVCCESADPSTLSPSGSSCSAVRSRAAIRYTPPPSIPTTTSTDHQNQEGLHFPCFTQYPKRGHTNHLCQSADAGTAPGSLAPDAPAPRPDGSPSSCSCRPGPARASRSPVRPGESARQSPRCTPARAGRGSAPSRVGCYGLARPHAQLTLQRLVLQRGAHGQAAAALIGPCGQRERRARPFPTRRARPTPAGELSSSACSPQTG